MEIDLKLNSSEQCRLCGNYGDHQFELFDSPSGEISSSLSEKIFRCLDIEVVSSDSSTVVCAECFTKLHGYDEFREVCHATNRQMNKSDRSHHNGIGNGVILNSDVKRETVIEPVGSYTYISLHDSDSEPEVAADELVIPEYLAPKIERSDDDLDVQLNDSVESSADGIPVFASTSSALVKHECPEIETFLPKLEMIFHEELVELPMDASENESATNAEHGGDDREIIGDERNECSLDVHGSDSQTEIDTDSDGVEHVAPAARKKSLRESRLSIPTIRIKKEHKVNKIMKKNSSKSLVKCSRGKCSNSFKNREAMEFHVNTYHKKGAERTFCCHMCKRTKATRQHLMMHMNALHTPVVRFMCPNRDCSKIFTDKSNLKTHINVIHKKRVAFRCPICSEAFFREHFLKKHLAIEHGDGIAFVCDLCPKSFSSKGNLTVHIKSTHTHVTMFKCPAAKCSKSFNIKSTMESHFNAVHSQKTVFKCTKCPAKFNWRGSLHRHLALQH